MNRYETYKDSGIPWLGEIPEHWNICRLKDEVTFNDEVLGDKTDTDYEILYVDISNVSLIEGIIQKELMTFEHSPSRARRIVKNGDVIVSTVRTYLKAITQIQDAEDNLIVSTGFAVLRPKADLFPRFLGYWVQSENMIGAIVSNSVGVSYPAINATDLVRLPIVKLPKKEQIAIVHYLDTKLGEIDALIGKQQTLLDKLAEQRTAVITHAVTKGLNPAAPMKNSGVEWLGDVPAHWETWKITHAIDLIGSGTTPKSDNTEYYDGDVLWVTTSELRENFISDTKQKVSNSAIKDYSALKIYPVNSVAMAMYGATIGRLGILEKEATFNQACCVFGISKILYYKFLFYWLWHRRPILISLSNGGGQPNLSQDDLKKLKVPIPGYEEQVAIADYLDQETAKIDRLCDTVNQTIGRLKEYRTALITQAVTGKIKVTDE